MVKIKKLFNKFIAIFNSRQTAIPEFLKQWALISGDYTESGEIVTNKWSKQMRILQTLFLTIYSVKLITSLLLPEDSVWLYYIGDTSVVLDNQSSKTYLIILHLAITLKSFATFLHFWLKESPDLMLWLRPTLIFKGKETIIDLTKN